MKHFSGNACKGFTREDVWRERERRTVTKESDKCAKMFKIPYLSFLSVYPFSSFWTLNSRCPFTWSPILTPSLSHKQSGEDQVEKQFLVIQEKRWGNSAWNSKCLEKHLFCIPCIVQKVLTLLIPMTVVVSPSHSYLHLLEISSLQDTFNDVSTVKHRKDQRVS